MHLVQSPSFDEFFWPTFSPANYEVRENDQAVTIAIEVPGVAKDAIEVELIEDVLHVQYKRKNRQYHRQFQVPESTEGDISAELKDGVLSISIPKKQPAKRKITVK